MSSAGLDSIDLTTRFPPTFDNSPYTYAFALASLSAISFVSIGLLLSWLFEARSFNSIRIMAFNKLAPGKRGVKPSFWGRYKAGERLTLFHYHRIIMGSFLVSFAVGTLPDTITMLLWGEASDDVMEAAFLADRICDGIAVFPFMFGVVTGWRCRDALAHTLQIAGEYDPPNVSWRMVRERGRAVLLLVVMAILVSFYKTQL